MATHNRDGWQLARALAEREERTTPAVGGGGQLRDAAAARASGRSGMPPEVSRVSSRWFAAWPAAAALIIAAAGLTFYFGGTPPGGPGGTVPGSRPDADHVPSGSAPASASSAPGSSSAPSAVTTPAGAGPSPSASSAASAAGASTSPAPDTVASGTVASRPPTPLRKLGPGDIALYLPASVLRGPRPTASITSATQTVRVDIEIEPPVPSRVNIAVVQVPTNGEAVFSQVDVPTVRVRGGEHIASVHVPARVLPTGAIEVVVTSTDKGWTPRVFPVLLRRD